MSDTPNDPTADPLSEAKDALRVFIAALGDRVAPEDQSELRALVAKYATAAAKSSYARGYTAGDAAGRVSEAAIRKKIREAAGTTDDSIFGSIFGPRFRR